jgi:RHS repeat-associated protein
VDHERHEREGSTAVMTDKTTGTLTSEVRYKAWGEDRYSYGTSPTSYRYTGQRQESTIGLYFYGARWYDSALGRFTSPDSIIPAQQGVMGNDRYAYVNNSPINYNDPTGHIKDCSLVAECESIPIPGAYFNPAPVNDFNNGEGYLFHDPRDSDHSGIDYSEMQGETLVSPGQGTVVAIGDITDEDTLGFGNVLILEVPYSSLSEKMREVAGLSSRESLFFLYAHLQSPTSLNQGDTVTPGQVVGYVGSTGNSSGPHLHFEIRIGPRYNLNSETFRGNYTRYRNFTAINPKNFEDAYDHFYVIPSTPVNPNAY